jgi:hypothetical protein
MFATSLPALLSARAGLIAALVTRTWLPRASVNGGH